MKLEEIEGFERLATKEDLKLLATKEDLHLMAGELRVEMAQIRTAIAELKVDLLKWMIGVQLSFAAIILGAVYAMLTHWKP
jgi:hypothetical protein